MSDARERRGGWPGLRKAGHRGDQDKDGEMRREGREGRYGRGREGRYGGGREGMGGRIAGRMLHLVHYLI